MTCWFLTVTLTFGFTGCAQRELLDEVISAKTDREYNLWFSRHNSRFSPQLRERFLQAMQQTKLEVSIVTPHLTSAEHREQFVHGANIRQIIAYGEMIRLQRIAVENYIDGEMLDANQLQVVRPDSDPSIGRTIREQIRAIEQRMRIRKNESDAIELRLHELLPPGSFDLRAHRPRKRTDLPAQLVAQTYARPQDIPLTSAQGLH